MIYLTVAELFELRLLITKLAIVAKRNEENKDEHVRSLRHGALDILKGAETRKEIG